MGGIKMKKGAGYDKEGEIRFVRVFKCHGSGP
jgi:hypothetical protein